jgi:hypothetical protein
MQQIVHPGGVVDLRRMDAVLAPSRDPEIHVTETRENHAQG